MIGLGLATAAMEQAAVIVSEGTQGKRARRAQWKIRDYMSSYGERGRKHDTGPKFRFGHLGIL